MTLGFERCHVSKVREDSGEKARRVRGELVSREAINRSNVAKPSLRSERLSVGITNGRDDH